MGNKIKVSVLGKGDEQVTVEKEQTIKDLRDLLALDQDVIASTEEGKELSDNAKVSELSGVNFTPNVQGGRQ